MNRSELVHAISRQTDLPPQQVDAVLAGLDAVLIGAARRGERVTMPGLLSVETVERPARTMRNPRDDSLIHFAGARVARVRIGPRLKRAARGDGLV